LVFRSPDGSPLRPDNYRKRVFYPATRAAAIEPTPRVHDMRHTAASLMAQCGYTMRQEV
jgi:integrase